LLFERCDQNKIRVDAAAQTFQRRQRGGAILFRTRKSLEKGVVAREYCSSTRDLLIALVDQFLKTCVPARRLDSIWAERARGLRA
jgi:hypothetical protein